MTDLPLIGHWDPIAQLYLLAFMLSVLFGAVARKTEFCPLGGIADILYNGNSGRLRMYFFAIGVAMLGALFLEAASLVNLDGTRPPYRMSQFRWPGYVIGGMLFGIGMTLCRGCGMKNMINLGAGNLKALVAILGMGLAAVLLLYVEGVFEAVFLSWAMPLTPDLARSGMAHQDLGTVVSVLTGASVDSMRIMAGLLIAGALIVYAFRSAQFRGRFDNILGGLLIGLMITGAFYISGGALGELAQEASDFMDQPQNGMGVQSYTFIRPMGDLLYVMANPLWYLVTFGLVMFLGVGAGSVLLSLLTGRFRLQWFASPLEGVRFFTGGMLVGIGGILGMGCTLGQGLAGTSTLAMGSFLNVASLIAGAVIGIKLQKHFMDDHEVPA